MVKGEASASPFAFGQKSGAVSGEAVIRLTMRSLEAATGGINNKFY
jgi:hypothetical protein